MGVETLSGLKEPLGKKLPQEEVHIPSQGPHTIIFERLFSFKESYDLTCCCHHVTGFFL
jgi:hypothetical protein